MKAGRVLRVLGACVVWVLVGAVVNVGVAWGMAILPETWFPNRLWSQTFDESVTEWPYPTSAHAVRPDDAMRSCTLVYDKDSGFFRSGAWYDHDSGVRLGWPFRSVATWTETLQIGDPPRVVHRYAVMWRTERDVAGVVRMGPWGHELVLGWYPLWPGFVANTLMYGFVCFCVWRGVGFVRARRRKRHGLCAACGYDLRGLVEGTACPECGSSCGPVIEAAERRELVAQGGAQRNPGFADA